MHGAANRQKQIAYITLTFGVNDFSYRFDLKYQVGLLMHFS